LTDGGHISAEDLQLLAAGAVPEGECAAMRAHAAECAECGAKLAEERGRAALLGLAAEQEKTAATIKAELFARIRAEREEEETYRWQKKADQKEAAPQGSTELVKAGRAPREDPGQASPAPTKGFWRGWILVPVTAALVILTVWEWRDNQRLAKDLAGANHRIVEMANERQRAEMLVDFLSAADTTSVKLAAETEKTSGMVRYNPRQGMVVYTAELPALPVDKIYQMWLVPKTGAPISAGIFAPGPHGTRQLWTATVPLNTEVKAFAVTIEPAGGVPQPTGPKVLVGAS